MTIYATDVPFPHELARLELTPDALTVATYRALAQRQRQLGPVPFETALRLVSILHSKNCGRAFRLDYDLAVVDVVVRALQWFAYDVERAHTSLLADWLLRYEQLDHHRDTSRHVGALQRALTNAYSL